MVQNTKFLTPLKRPMTKEESEYIRQRRDENLDRALKNGNENWMARHLAKTGFKWTRQAIWGYRIFDFWNGALGIAVEVDGIEHNKEWDRHRDEYNYLRSGILVLRVRNRNEEDAAKALKEIMAAETWKQRREKLGVDSGSLAHRRRLVLGDKTVAEVRKLRSNPNRGTVKPAPAPQPLAALPLFAERCRAPVVETETDQQYRNRVRKEANKRRKAERNQREALALKQHRRPGEWEYGIERKR